MFVEITRGRSFGGLARYCLHDQGRLPTSERVDFAAVENMGTDNPHVAWRLMAAKHYQQDRLKELAGVGRGGPKDGKPVGHLLLSWKKEEAEAERLDREKMIQAAKEALRSIGASQREAIFVAHNDTEHPHLHVILCLIKEDGRLKSNWKEREKLSKWALERERRLHGEALVKKREENWEARKRGETPAPEKKMPRHLYELYKAAESDPQLAQFAERHRRELARLERQKEANRLRSDAQKRRLLDQHLSRQQRRQRALVDRLAAMKTSVRKAHQTKWRELLAEQEAQRRQFQKNERSLKGRVANTFKSVDWRRVVGSDRRMGAAKEAMKQVFRSAGEEAIRLRGVRRKQERDKAALLKVQQQLEKRQKTKLGKQHGVKTRLGRMAFLKVDQALEQKHKGLKQEQRRSQRSLTRERNEAMRASRARTWSERVADKLTLSLQQKKRESKPKLLLEADKRTKPLELVGGSSMAKRKVNSKEVARQVDEAKVVIKQRKRRERKPRKKRETRGSREK